MNDMKTLFLGTFLLLGNIAAHAALPVTLTVKETTGVSRTNEIVHNGIPLSKEDNITSISSLAIGGAPSGNAVSGCCQLND